MYNEFYGLRRNPFNMTPDPEFLYLTPQHREALAGLTYAIIGRKGFVVVTGDAGTGKTTLLARALRQFPVAHIQCSIILNPTLTPAEFLEATLLDFGFTDIPASKAQRIVRLQSLLMNGYREGRICALLVDEAHKLSPEVLEEIRLLGNFEVADQKLLQVALVGQNELDTLLGREQLRQFKQRVALHLTVAALSATDVEQYVRYRWIKAGGRDLPFSEQALCMIAQASEGIPRVINAICDNALVQAFGEGSTAVQVGQILTVCADLRLNGHAKPAPAAAAPEVVPALPAIEDFPIKTLNRYCIGAAKPSRLARFAAKLGLAHRTESA